ncbi:hypothetical protein HDA32_003494 [Spinactinospora alkalitolerans]|uniref:Secreted protein n=1 Tax=Spinactinospora alkalitolerans TaxID=687207 RepID=A0A852U2K0_9ACTN|nr:hypothetical protein [Spinactinospora alkalitolerans]NYE48374.1 hypothetical protein [Spinactinospora alkalitolerans]
MDTGLIIGIVVAAIVLVLIVAAVAVIVPGRRRRRLREKFGPEYDRAVERHHDPKAAERELAGREKRHSRLKLRPLSPEARDGYAQGWVRIQERFVDAPVEAVAEADSLVTRLMADRGYPTEGFEQQAADLSVEHARTIDHYRAARDISERSERGESTTEELRTAMVHYRTLFSDLLDRDLSGNGGGQGRHAADPNTPEGSDGYAETGPPSDAAPGDPGRDEPHPR